VLVLASVAPQLDTRADRVVAIKRVRKVSYKEGVNLGAIKELQALTELDHPNILKVRALHSTAPCTTYVAGSPPHAPSQPCPTPAAA
jgi:hypothetical protein